MSYLLDTNICVHWLSGDMRIDARLKAVDPANCYLSEVTELEVLYGIANSSPTHRKTNQDRIPRLEMLFQDRILPIRPAFPHFAEQKANLRRTGRLVGDFDLLIGCTALAHDLTLVTRNVKDFVNLPGLRLENWVDA